MKIDLELFVRLLQADYYRLEKKITELQMAPGTVAKTTTHQTHDRVGATGRPPGLADLLKVTPEQITHATATGFEAPKNLRSDEQT